jgi:poly(3-hydroxybutyrate) depolymerase
VHYLQPKVGHYGVFNGSRFRAEIQPRISDFMVSLDMEAAKDRRDESAGEQRKALKIAG